MCFFTLQRYRLCQHDQVGPFVAFCTIAITRASPNENYTAQHSHQDVFNSFADTAVDSNPHTRLDFCGQLLFSPKYINDFGADAVNGGVCENCIEMKRRMEEGTQFSQRTGRQYYHQQTADDPHQHLSSLNFGDYFIPPQESFHHPLIRSQIPVQRRPTLPRHHASPRVQSRTYPETPVTASSQNPENAVLQQILHSYPLLARTAVEQAVANQTPEQREQTLQTYRAVLEGRMRPQNMEQVVADGTRQ